MKSSLPSCAEIFAAVEVNDGLQLRCTAKCHEEVSGKLLHFAHYLRRRKRSTQFVLQALCVQRRAIYELDNKLFVPINRHWELELNRVVEQKDRVLDEILKITRWRTRTQPTALRIPEWL